MYIAALLPNESDRHALSVAAGSHHTVLWADGWRTLQTLVRSRPVSLVITDVHAEPRKDGVLRVYRFAQRFPMTPLVSWGNTDARDLFRLGKAGVRDVMLASDAGDPEIVGELLDAVHRSWFPRALADALAERLAPEALAVVRAAAEGIENGLQVPDLAGQFNYSISTLERRCEVLGLPTPGRLLLWLRVLCGLRWLLEEGRSVESVAAQLGYSSGAAFRRAIKATVGGRPTPLRNDEAYESNVERFALECGAQPVAGAA